MSKSWASWLDEAAFRSASPKATRICSRSGPRGGDSPWSSRCWRSTTCWITGLTRLANASVMVELDHEERELEIRGLATLGGHDRQDPIALERRARQVHADGHR